MKLPAPALISAAGHVLLLGALVFTAHPIQVRPQAPVVRLQAALLPGRPSPSPAPSRPASRKHPASSSAPHRSRPAPRSLRAAAPAPEPPVLTSSGVPTTTRELAQAAPAKAPSFGHPVPAAGPTAAPRPSSSGTGKPAGAGTGNYYGRILARLEKVKRYPESERRLGREGTVLVRFVLARGGRVLECRIQKGSGTAALDDEVLRMVRQAAPFPPFPKALERDRLVLLVPVTFSLQRQG